MTIQANQLKSSAAPPVTRSSSILAVIAVVFLLVVLFATPDNLATTATSREKTAAPRLKRGKIASRLSKSYDKACAKLLAAPRMKTRCSKDRKLGWQRAECENGTVAFQSQFDQDYYLYTRHFQHLRRQGVYLDVAANEPISISNTWVFDACLDWRGVCVEANPFYIKRLRTARTCHLVPTCVGDVEGEKVTFVLGKGMGGIAETNKNMHRVGDNDKISLKCTTLRKQLKAKDVTRVDYFTLDVEGHEMYVLRGIDWDAFAFNVMTVEVSKDTADEIEEFLIARGYVRHIPTLSEKTRETGRLHQDLVFLHKDVVFGSPV